ncbi:formate dehydrogenase subunit gamma [Chloroflexota bacterium]
MEKYRKCVRVLHWIHTASFLPLFITGSILFIPQLGFLAEDGWTRIIHRTFAAIFVIVPITFLIVKPKSAFRGLKEAFTWGSDDIGWLKAAPAYYFLGDEQGMPPQGHINTEQKMWWFLVVVFGIIFVITGAFAWFAKVAYPAMPAAAMQWMVFVHDIAFIVTGTMLFVHIYLGVFHPFMAESLGAMTRGKISTDYAKMHHRKWYEEVIKTKEEKT